MTITPDQFIETLIALGSRVTVEPVMNGYVISVDTYSSDCGYYVYVEDGELVRETDPWSLV
jgi:hypothetical protein